MRALCTGTLVKVDHPERGEYISVGCPIKLSASPAKVTRSPMLGEHTAEILSEVLGYSADEMKEIIESVLSASKSRRRIKHVFMDNPTRIRLRGIMRIVLPASRLWPSCLENCWSVAKRLSQYVAPQQKWVSLKMCWLSPGKRRASASASIVENARGFGVDGVI